MPESSQSPRLAPIRRSWNPLVWLAALIYRLTMGRVAAPIRVVYARAPCLILGHLILVATAEYGLSLDRRAWYLTRVFGSRLNDCMFCDDLETYMALRHGAISRADIAALPHYATAEEFTERSEEHTSELQSH